MPMKNHLSPEQLQRRAISKEEDVRGPYYRDTTAIIHCSAFRRLKQKTQVFYAPANDHICTRIEHSLHVASIASTICRGLGLDSELAWAIGMGHDLGHTPFGHTGETILSKKMVEAGLPAFEHELHSLRVVDFLSNGGKGLNLTYAVRDGIASHNGEMLLRAVQPTFEVKDLSSLSSRVGLLPATWEAAVVRQSDTIAYIGRDFEDATRLGLIEWEELDPAIRKTLGSSNAQIIDTLVMDIIRSSSKEEGICFSDEVFEQVEAMMRFNYQRIYKSPLLESYERYFTRLFTLVADYLKYLLEECREDERCYRGERNMLAGGFYRHLMEIKETYLAHDGNLDRLRFDYIAGMSDTFCLECANEILKPEYLNDEIATAMASKWFDVSK
ncbi:MAG TPA: HD domain-containing protein [Sphaerochaeta sp.]|nr:HD domain-containing protein [Sphaerochaeta sp.]